MSPPTDKIESWQHAGNDIQKIVDSATEFRSSIDSIVAAAQAAARPYGSIFNQIALSVERSTQQFRKLKESSIFPILEEITKNVRKLPAQTKEALILFGQRGWYVDFEMSLPEVWRLSRALGDGHIENVEQALALHFENRIDAIEQAINKLFPERKKLITAAFSAHRRQEYELSIPVLLAQTDGICKDAINEYLFMKCNKKPRTAIYVEDIEPDSITAALLSPLAENLPIGQSLKERNEDFVGLNRHAVLHGQSLDYGTEINALKAISLINYVAHVLTKDDESKFPD